MTKIPAELRSADPVADDANRLGLHVGFRVIEYDPEMAEGVLRGREPVGTAIAEHVPVMEPIEIDAFAVDLCEGILLVTGLSTLPAVSIATGIPPPSISTTLCGIADARAGIEVDADFRCVAHLDSVAANREESVGEIRPREFRSDV